MKRDVESLTDVDYVRYLLALKMWKRTKENLEERKKVNKVALMILGPCAPKMRDELLKIIPKPIRQENETLWLLQPNVFDLKTACNNFLAFEESMSVQFKDSYSTMVSDLTHSQKQQVISSELGFISSSFPRASMFHLLCFQIISSCGVNHIQECAMNYKLNKHETCNSQDTSSSENTIDSSKFANKICSAKRRSKFKKHKRTSKLKPGEILLVDLTEDNESLRVDKNKNRKARCKRRLEWLKMTKKKYKAEKQVGKVKCRNQVEIADAHSTENSENSVDKILLEYLPISDNKVSESTESCTSVEEEPLGNNTHYVHSQNMHDYICNKRSKQLKGAFQHKQCDNCASPLKQNDVQHSRLLSSLKLLNVVGQNVKEPKAGLNVLRESSEQNVMPSQHTVSCRNTADEASEVDTQDKEELFSQPKSSIETILLSKECQNSIVNTQSIKQELPTSTDCNTTEADTCRHDASVYVQSDSHLHGFRSMNSHSSQATEAARQKASYDAHECTSCCKKTEVKPFLCHNYSIFNTKNEDTTQNGVDDNSSDKKPICDKSVICMLSDLDKCMDVLNRVGEHIMTVHAEKQRLECSDKTDMCAVSTTVLEDQIAKSPLRWAQNIHSLTNSEKFSKILELYGKKEFMSSCNSKDHHRCDNKEATAMLNQVKCESENLKKLMVSASQTKELHSHGKDHANFTENKLLDGFICGRIKSEFEPSIKEEDCENFEVVSDQSKNRNKRKVSVTNDQPRAIDSLAYDLNNEGLYEDALSRKSDLTKTRTLDEFENIDILDSILNGDITMEDEQEIFEDSQSSLMSPIDYDNSNNVLNCISEFFLQSEHSYTNEKEERYVTSDIENSSTPLPEGSLGTTGILNSLLNFELTNMDSLPNDFMYSNVQAVNSRLIKKSFEGVVFSMKNESESDSQGKVVEADKNDAEEMLSRKRDEFCNNRSDSVNSDVDLVGFGLNTSREETHEFPTLVRNLSSLSSQSTTLPNSDDISSETKELFPKYSLSSPVDKLSTDTVIERSYIFRNEDTINQVQSFSHAINRVSPSICTSNSLLSNELMNYTSSRRDDSPSSHKHAHMKLVTSTLAMEQPSDCNLLSSTDLVSCKTVTASRSELPECKNSPKQKNVQKNVRNSCEEKQNHIRKHRIEVSAQSRASKQKLRYKKIKQAKKEEGESPSSIVRPTQDELSLRCSQLTVINPLNHQDAQSTRELPLSFHMSYRQKSPRAIYAPKNMYKQLKCVGMHQLRNMSERKQQILLNFHGNSTTNTIITEDSKVENSQCTTEDNTSEDSNALRESVQPQTPEKACFKLSKRNVKVDADVVEANLTTDKRVTEISNNILMKSGTKWMSQNIDAQPLKFVKKQVVATVEEERPLKKKKLSPKFSTLGADAIVCSMNQQEVHFASVKKGKFILLLSLPHFSHNFSISLL